MRLESVGKRYGARQPWVVRDVSADVPAGRLIRVAGRNGSGKSTLLRVAAGVMLPSRGRVSGRPHTGYVPERFPGALPFSGREYLLHMARVHGLRGETVRRRADEWLERLGAAGYAEQPLRDLSKGMCQKIAIIQALLSAPGLLVLDEAWTGLDVQARGALDAAATERAATGGIVLFVDHDPARLAGLAGQRWLLDGDGLVTVLPGDNPVPETPPDGGTAVTVELAGIDAGSLAPLAALPGVLACEARDEPPGAGHARLVVAAGYSDAVLRTVLTWDGVHVVSVRGQGGATTAPPAAAPAPATTRPGG